MIFHIYYTLIMAGYAACSVLLGSYMMYYAGAREIDLGFLFMIQPATIILRPFICARADRYQSHKQMMALFSLLTSVSYVPFIMLPFMSGPSMAIEPEELNGENEFILSDLLSGQQLKYWLLVLFQLLGSIGFCGVRSLGDALAVNYAKRIGSDFARYRKYGSMSYGISGLALGAINQGWLLPDFTPHLIMYSFSMFALAVLIYAWPGQYFEMASSDTSDEQAQREYCESLPGPGETLRHIGKQLGDVVTCRWGAGDEKLRREHEQIQGESSNARGQQFATNLAIGETHKTSTHLAVPDMKTSAKRSHYGTAPELLVDDRTRVLSVKQQLSIFALLLKRDFRIALYLLTIFYGGLVGYSGPNFVFTYINVTCHSKGTCDSAQLTGLVMFTYCVVETLCYILIDKFRGRLNRVLMIEITFVSLAIHYYFYGFALDHLSPYWFLMESLHGVEYSISLSTSVELGYYFAREVQVLLPELIQRGIINQNDDKELVKVSLMATMSGCYTLVYDGFGCILGSLIFGIITGQYSFIATWITIGTLAVIGFVSILFIYSVGKCFNIRPEILRMRDRQIAAGQLND